MLPARGDEADVLERSAELALRLVERGATGEFHVALQHPVRFRWGRWLLPLAESLDVETDGHHAVVTAALSGGRRRVALTREDNGWTADDGTPLAVLNLGGGPILLTAADAEQCQEHRHGHRPFPPADLPRVFEELQAAAALIARYAPVYLPWVLRVVRHIVAVTAVPDGELASGSFLHRPSLIFVASPMPIAVLAELLAHEACHQHLWLATQGSPVDDGTDRRSRHYSPYVSKQRNLRMMLLTYHAFANAVLFHRECYSRGLVDPIAQKRERMFAQLFDPYERVLSDSPSLTPLGRQLWQTVSEEVRSRMSDPAA